MKKFQYGIDKNISIPLHYQIKKSLEDFIKTNYLKLGDKIPTESELCKLFSVSRPTVRRGIDQLVKEGMLRKNTGKGTFVCDPTVERSYSKLMSLTEQYEEFGINLEAELIKKEVIPVPHELVNVLEIESNEKVVLISRLRKVNKKPLCVVHNFLPYSNFSRLIEENVSKKSFLKIIEDRFGIFPSRAKQNVSASKSNEFEAKYLNIKKDDPVLVIERVYLTSSRSPIFFTKMVFRRDFYSYKSNLMR
jgi:GntR family transcriptional regulator